jgi:catechol 2,3-dioxygenase-like lactoylglutathione lyase family enzyme
MTATPAFSPPKIAQIELHCTDLEAAKRFYCESLGLRLVGQVGDSIFVRCGEVNLIVQQTPTPQRGSTIYFNADGRVREATEALKSQGIVFTQEPRCIVRGHDGNDIWLGFFDDPWGNPLALLSNMPAT